MASLEQIDLDIMVVTSTYVMIDNMPILYVSRDSDDEGGDTWQFHCGNGDYNMDKMLLVRLENILKKDNTLINIDLKIGEQIERASVSSKWIKSSQ